MLHQWLAGWINKPNQTKPIIVPTCMEWLTKLPACPLPHKKCCIPKTGLQLAESESSIISQRPCGGTNLRLESVTWWYNGQKHITLLQLIKALSKQTVHSADSKHHMTVVTPTQKVICGMSGATFLTILFHVISWTARFSREKVIELKMCISIFSTSVVWNISQCRKTRDILLKVHRSSCEVTVHGF